ncbi:hypothetical protein HanIR_Chr02g0088091 [Helianthus annuus]|nr:hypothetical protein HanIR_Chr02g0088091 [Helianthus annuus]
MRNSRSNTGTITEHIGYGTDSGLLMVPPHTFINRTYTIWYFDLFLVNFDWWRGKKSHCTCFLLPYGTVKTTIHARIPDLPLIPYATVLASSPYNPAFDSFSFPISHSLS